MFIRLSPSSQSKAWTQIEQTRALSRVCRKQLAVLDVNLETWSIGSDQTKLLCRSAGSYRIRKYTAMILHAWMEGNVVTEQHHALDGV